MGAALLGGLKLGGKGLGIVGWVLTLSGDSAPISPRPTPTFNDIQPKGNSKPYYPFNIYAHDDQPHLGTGWYPTPVLTPPPTPAPLPPGPGCYNCGPPATTSPTVQTCNGCGPPSAPYAPVQKSQIVPEAPPQWTVWKPPVIDYSALPITGTIRNTEPRSATPNAKPKTADSKRALAVQREGAGYAGTCGTSGPVGAACDPTTGGGQNNNPTPTTLALDGTGAGKPPGSITRTTLGHPDDDGEWVNISTEGRTPEEVEALYEYARGANEVLRESGPQTIRSTKGSLARGSRAAARAERIRAEKLNQPYSGQAGHVPDTAVSGEAEPPGGWLDMPGVSNQAAGGVLGSRIGRLIIGFTIDGVVP